MDKSSLAERMRGIWMETLQVPVAEDSDYFALGGHSFQALQIIARIDGLLGTRLPLRSLFDAPRFADFVDSVAAEAGISR